MSADKNTLDFSKCMVPNCDNGVHNNYTLFRIPKSSNRRKTWLGAIGNAALMECSSSLLNKGGVCKNHFCAESFLNSEKKKLRPYANPVNLNVPEIAKLRETILNFPVKPINKENSSPQIIRNNDYSDHRTNNYVEITDLANVTSWPTSAKIDKVNNDNYVFKKDNMFFKQNENAVSKTLYYSEKDTINTLNRSINEMNFYYESRVFQNNCVLGDNVPQVFEKSQTDNSQNFIIGDVLGNNELKDKISMLEKENAALRNKLRKFERINRERTELLQKCNSMQKNITKQEKIILSLCKEIKGLRK